VPVYRSALAVVLRHTAAAYGYALTIATTTQVLASTHGSPGMLDLWLFLLGGVGAFAVLEAVLQLLPKGAGVEVDHAFPLAGVLNVVATSGGFGTGALAAHLLGGAVAWPVAAFAATTAYLAVASAQAALIGARVSR
jgi:hypothetical protein